MAKWTTEHLKEYFAALMVERDKAVAAALAAQEKAVAAALSAADRAVLKAEAASEKRFEGVNEFRATLSDQATRLMPREEAVTRIDALGERLVALATRVTTSEGRSTGRADYLGWIIAAITIIAAVIGIVISITRH
jgi:hypothetical protein